MLKLIKIRGGGRFFDGFELKHAQTHQNQWFGPPRGGPGPVFDGFELKYAQTIEKTSDLNDFPGGPPGREKLVLEFPLGIRLARGNRPPRGGPRTPGGGSEVKKHRLSKNPHLIGVL